MIQINKKYKIILLLFSILILMNLIQESYAKYISSASANGNFIIAKWAFKVNNQDVLNNQDFSNKIIPVIEDNAHIKSGVIAPTSTGYIDLNIDYSDVAVDFTETISLSYKENSSVTDLVITGYQLNDGEIIEFNNSASLSLNHSIQEENKIDRYRFFIKWKDGTGENMDNQADTLASVEGNAAVSVNVNFIQKASS
ncbi:MAG: hypothetical protein IJ704_00170 [Bacilli bacterium]|nr:hypothetical protein [Bacilli bacterium]